MVAAPTRKKSEQPGKSGITPCKHFLLNRLLGREMGVLSRGMPPVKEVLLYDLTAGDGVPYVPTEQGELLPRAAFGDGCSPGIFLRHADFLVRCNRLPVRLTSCEKQAITHSELLKNTGSWLAANEWMELSRGVHVKGYGEVRYLNANSQELQPPLINRDAACFIYNDPNHIEDWSLTAEFVRNCPKFTTSLSTLGCNVGGLKRIEEGKRREWFTRVEVLCESLLQNWHDACLFSVGGADQWAYLITAPSKWRDEITNECLKAAQRLEKKITAPPQVVWRKQNPGAFHELQRFLFLTRDEFNRGVEL
jgi:hypothetical protein